MCICIRISRIFFAIRAMDAVVLANYATEHATYAIRCMEAGKHVLSECLPCETMQQAVELIECVEKTGRVYAFAENCCYMPHTFEFWRRYQDGEIGEAAYAEGEYIHDCSPIWPQITMADRNHWRNRMHAEFLLHAFHRPAADDHRPAARSGRRV